MIRSSVSAAGSHGGRLVAAAAAATLVIALLPGATSAAGTIVFDGSPGTNPPPATLGGYPMTPFGPDGAAASDLVTSVPAPTGGVVGFGQSLQVYPAGSLGGGWTSGYGGHAYFQPGATPPIVLTLPVGTKAFYFYAEHNQCGSFTVTAIANDGTTSGPVPTGPVCSAISSRYFGFYVTGGATLTAITVSTSAPSFGMIVGQFGINVGSSAPSPAAVPVISGFSPGAGKVGSTVTILGTSFSYARSVTFSGVPATFSVRTPTIIVATVPAGATTGPIRVTTPFGSATYARSFVVLP